MSIARNLSSRCMRQLRPTPSALRSSTVQRSARRGYASMDEAATKAKDAANKAKDTMKDTANKAKETAKTGLASEMPWIVTALAVTIPGTYLILTNGKTSNPMAYPMPGSHYHGESHDDHEEGEENDEGEEHEETDEEPADDSSKEEGKDDEAKQGDGEDEDKQEDSGDDAKPAGDDEEGKQEGGKEPESGDDNKRTELGKPGEKEGKTTSDVPDDNTISKTPAAGGSGKFDEKQELEHDIEGGKKIHWPDAKGGAKRRIESPYGNKLGKEGETATDGQGPDDTAAQSKDPKPGFDSMSGKQAGLSNTDTKHSVKIDEMDDKSKKAEGGPDTAKLQGTVDPNRPAK